MIDSNTFLSGIVFDGMERLLPRTLVHSDHALLLAKFSVSEVGRVMRRKFPGMIEDYEDVLQSPDAEILFFPDKSEVEQCIEIIRDDHDAPILASAIKARPDVFVTGDKDFFEERVRALIRVATTRETLKLIQESKI
jgi:predicted nucleic acid-binding protein